MNALNKIELTDGLISDLGLERKEAKQAVDCFFSVLSSVIVSDEVVKISGFGNFSTRFKKERPGLNPKTGRKVMVSARKVVTFKAGVKLKKLIQPC